MKISYLLATAKPEHCAGAQIKRINELAPHDKEIIVASPNENFAKIPGVTYVKDDKMLGGAIGFNLAYEAATGDLIIVATDDHILPLNLLDIFDVIKGDAIKKQKCRLGCLSWGMGGPGFPTWDKRIKDYPPNSLWPLYSIHPQDVPNVIPYAMATFPILFKEDIDKFLDGKIFNTCFHQAFSDNWLSRYVYEINKCEIGWPDAIWAECNLDLHNLPNSSPFKSNFWHDKDYLTYLRLVSVIDKGINYNYQVPHE